MANNYMKCKLCGNRWSRKIGFPLYRDFSAVYRPDNNSPVLKHTYFDSRFEAERVSCPWLGDYVVEVVQ